LLFRLLPRDQDVELAWGRVIYASQGVLNFKFDPVVEEMTSQPSEACFLGGQGQFMDGNLFRPNAQRVYDLSSFSALAKAVLE